MQIDTWIKKEQESLIALRRWFHMHPEPSMKEYETAAKNRGGADADWRCTPPNQRNRGFCQHKRRKRKWKGSCFACGYGRFVHGGFAGQKLSQCEFRVCTCVRP